MTTKKTSNILGSVTVLAFLYLTMKNLTVPFAAFTLGYVIMALYFIIASGLMVGCFVVFYILNYGENHTLFKAIQECTEVSISDIFELVVIFVCFLISAFYTVFLNYPNAHLVLTVNIFIFIIKIVEFVMLRQIIKKYIL